MQNEDKCEYEQTMKLWAWGEMDMVRTLNMLNEGWHCIKIEKYEHDDKHEKDEHDEHEEYDKKRKWWGETTSKNTKLMHRIKMKKTMIMMTIV